MTKRYGPYRTRASMSSPCYHADMDRTPKVTTRQKLEGVLWAAIALAIVFYIVKWSPIHFPYLIQLIPGMTDL